MPIRHQRRDPERRAAEVLRLHLPGELSPPIPVEKIAERLGAEIQNAKLDEDLSGMLVRDSNRIIIAVASNHAWVRKRYTIAHELGHLVMHRGRPLIAETAHAIRVDRRLRAPGFADQREEREANQFAAALLMPPDLVTLHWNWQSGAVDAGMIRNLAELFGVSSVAMQYRLINLGLFIPHNTDEEEPKLANR